MKLNLLNVKKKQKKHEDALLDSELNCKLNFKHLTLPRRKGKGNNMVQSTLEPFC